MKTMQKLSDNEKILDQMEMKTKKIEFDALIKEIGEVEAENSKIKKMLYVIQSDIKKNEVSIKK
jgi:hypothetical protein